LCIIYIIHIISCTLHTYLFINFIKVPYSCYDIGVTRGEHNSHMGTKSRPNYERTVKYQRHHGTTTKLQGEASLIYTSGEVIALPFYT